MTIALLRTKWEIFLLIWKTVVNAIEKLVICQLRLFRLIRRT